MMQRPAKRRAEGKIEKPEDKEWGQWYSKLSSKEHQEYLSKLGLDDEEIKDWEGHHVLDEMSDPATDNAPAPKNKKK